MLLELAQWLAKDIRAFNVFNYITLRAVLACLTALVISFMIGPAMIRKLTAYKIGQAVRDDGPQTHLIKTGTPTMGGALILVSIVITVLLWADLQNRFVWIVLWVMLASGRSAGWTTIARWWNAIRRAVSAQGQVLLAVGDRAGRRLLHRVHHQSARPDRVHRAVLQAGRLPARRGRASSR